MSSAESSERKIPFTCPYCSNYTEVDARYAGQSGPCVSCSNVITVPRLEAHVASLVSVSSAKSGQPAWVKGGMVLAGILCASVLGVVVWSIIQPAYRAARAAARCSECEANLQAIGLALEDYYQANGEYPPAIVYDDNGQPKHSWRALLLPYLGLEGKRLSQMYKMDEPWDGPTNKNLVSSMPDVYLCPSDATAVQGETSYLAVVGPRTLINRDEPVRRVGGTGTGKVLLDNASETMVIIEASGCAVNWMKPQDIPVAALRAGLNSTNAKVPVPRSNHEQGVNILMADQSVLRVPQETSSEDLDAMATIDGNNEYIEILDEMAY